MQAQHIKFIKSNQKSFPALQTHTHTHIHADPPRALRHTTLFFSFSGRKGGGCSIAATEAEREKQKTTKRPLSASGLYKQRLPPPRLYSSGVWLTSQGYPPTDSLISISQKPGLSKGEEKKEGEPEEGKELKGGVERQMPDTQRRADGA